MAIRVVPSEPGNMGVDDAPDRRPPLALDEVLRRLKPATGISANMADGPGPLPDADSSVVSVAFSDAATRAASLEIERRRFRDRLFGPDLFADPAWDILLDLFVARARSQDVSVSDACLASAVPTSTGLRWIRTLEQMNLVHRRPDTKDGRRYLLELTDQAVRAMSDILRYDGRIASRH